MLTADLNPKERTKRKNQKRTFNPNEGDFLLHFKTPFEREDRSEFERQLVPLDTREEQMWTFSCTSQSAIQKFFHAIEILSNSVSILGNLHQLSV
jgi:hypothetical protein